MIRQKNQQHNRKLTIVLFIIILLFFLEDLEIFPKEQSITPSSNNAELGTAYAQQANEINKNCLQSASSYCLKAELKNEVLEIVLNDYKNWVIYKRQYTKQDIGLQIHRKIDLSQIIHVFRSQIGLIQTTNDFIYTFGSIQRGKNGQPLYMISQNGKLTVYAQVWTKNSKKITKSELNLLIVRNMNQMEIFNLKMEIQRRELLSIFSKEINSLELENMKMKHRLEILQGKKSNSFNHQQWKQQINEEKYLDIRWKEQKPSDSSSRYPKDYEPNRLQSQVYIEI